MCVSFVVLCVGGSVLVNGVFFDFTTHLNGNKEKACKYNCPVVGVSKRCTTPHSTPPISSLPFVDARWVGAHENDLDAVVRGCHGWGDAHSCAIGALWAHHTAALQGRVRDDVVRDL